MLSKYRRSLLILLAIAVWLIWCLPSLISNEPDAFQASGSVIVVMAILIYARERARRENEVRQAQRRQIVAMLDEHDKWGDYHESRVNRSAMEVELQILELRHSMNNKDKEKLELSSKIIDLQKKLEASSERHEEIYKEMQNSHAAWVDVHKDAENIVESQTPNAKALEKLEIGLVVLGTLQWGYGDRWVEYLHRLM